MRINKLLVPGHKEDQLTPLDSNYPLLELEQRVIVDEGQLRGASEVAEVQLRDDHLLELVYDDGTTWLCDPDTLEELYPGSLRQQRDGEAVFMLPDGLTGQPETRGGIIEKVALKALNVFTRKAAAKGMKLLAKELETKQLGDNRGLLRVSELFDLKPFLTEEVLTNTGPILLFIHGTNSSARGSFQELVGTELWTYITRTYDRDNILAFQHETLTKSPLQNAAELIGQLPKEAELHIITHSRGGLIGEILARCSDQLGSSVGFSAKEMAYLKGEQRDDDIKWIKAIQLACRTKRFKVTRFVRVACPTGGTTILSKRLDLFFNITLNLIGAVTGAAVNPAYIALKNLLTAAIDQKSDPDVLPGLEAMMPESPFIKVLNNQETEIARPVVAISGNCKAKVNFKALLILAEKVFFLAANDLVVNTQSMYAGSHRKFKLQYFFDEGTDVDHFHYFSNKKTNTAIQFALQSPGDGKIDGFQEYYRGGPFPGEAQQRAFGLPGGEYSTGEPSGKKPIVVLLPGIMGSCLTSDLDLIWMEYRRMLTGGLLDLDVKNKKIQATAAIATGYREFGEWLSKYYDVVVFPYDWRLSPRNASVLLAKRLGELLQLQQPVKVIAHSLGGVVVRDLMIFSPQLWSQLNESPQFRLVLLGVPFMGSHRIMNVLLGEDDIICKLSKLDLLHSKAKLLDVFRKFPGILALLPYTENKVFEDPDWWKKLIAANGSAGLNPPEETDLTAWGKYSNDVLKAFKKLDWSKAVYIAGHGRQTPCGYRLDTRKNADHLTLLSTGEGDESVTWDSGIPPGMIAGGNVYYVEHTHGDLANSRDMFPGIRNLLEQGSTTLFSKIGPQIRGEEKLFPKPATADFDLSEDGINRTLLGLSGTELPAVSDLPLKVTVTHGDVKYAKFPVLAGHFILDGVLYGEARIDKLLSGQLMERHRMGIYPGDIGSHDIVLTYLEEGFKGSIIVGIGEPDTLTPFDLCRTVEQAVAKFLLLVNGRDKFGAAQFKEPIGLSSFIIGCGYGGLSIDSSIQAVLTGILNANSKIGVTCGNESKRITDVEFIELYQDRALGAYYAVRRLGNDSGGALRIMPASEGIEECYGARQKVNIDQGQDWWNRITIAKILNDRKDAVKGMSYSFTTGAAREEQDCIYTLGCVVDTLVQSISTDSRWSEEKARAIFELLVPNRFKTRLKRHGNITWVLDDYSAGYPWELLQHKGEGVKPMCINAGMIRQLATTNSRQNIDGVTGDKALVVGDPNLSNFLPQLPGAEQEAKAVDERLKAHGYSTTPLIQREQDDIVTSLMNGGYRIIHLAGHGIYNPDAEKPTGMVIGKNNFLTACQIAQMSDTPELVFVNCCYLGKVNNVDEAFYQTRYKLAANIGTQLINNGVKAVIVAGWAVEYISAHTFATTFYDHMFEGKNFGEAVRAAREKIYNSNSKYNTWGAYQCYGNPWYRLKGAKTVRDEKHYVIAEQAEIDLANLDSDMRMSDDDSDNILSRLRAITEETRRSGVRRASIAEKEALIYIGLGKYDVAVESFKEMLAYAAGGYSFTAMEQYCNIRAKLLQKSKDSTAIRETGFDKLIEDLNALILLSPTDERYMLLASTWKRRCELYHGVPKQTQATVKNMQKAIQQSAKYYQEAYRIDATTYAYTNWIAMQNLLLMASGKNWNTVPELKSRESILATLTTMEDNFKRQAPPKDFWKRIEGANIQLIKWLLESHQAESARDQKTNAGLVIAGYKKVWDLMGSLDNKMVDVQNLDLMRDSLKGLKPNHWMIPRIDTLARSLERMAKKG